MSQSPVRADAGSLLQTDLSEALSFLSHNAREGHSSTLALLELQRVMPQPMAMSTLVERIERNARKSLAAIDDFMDLAAARTQPLRMVEIDLADLLSELVADAWTLANRHSISVRMTSDVQSAPLLADRELLAGTINKLLRDAAMRAPNGAEIGCALSGGASEWVVGIDDPGAPDSAAVGDAPPWDGKLPLQHGISPGLALAQVVTQRHGGRLRVRRGSSAGVVVQVAMPLHGAPAA